MDTCDWNLCDFIMASIFLGRPIVDDVSEENETFEETNYDSLED